MTRKIWIWILFSGFLFRSIQAEDIQIDLTKQNWYAKSGFSLQQIQNVDLLIKDSVKTKPPIILNELFPLQNRDSIRIRHFTLYTNFDINDKSLQYPLYLYFAWIGENWAIYLNGHLLHSEIHLKGDRIQKYKTSLYKSILLNNQFLKKGNNHLVIHIVGNVDPVSWIRYDNVGLTFSKPYLIITENIKKELDFQYKLIPNILSFVYLFFGFYHIFLFFNKGRKYHAYFGLFCIMLFLYTDLLINDIIPDSELVFKIKYPSQPLLIPLFLAYMENFVLRKNRLSKITRIFLIIGLGLASLFVIFPVYYFEAFLRIFYVVAIFYILYSIYFLIQLLKRKKETIQTIIIIGVFGLIFSGVYDILDSIFFYQGIRLLKYAFFLFILLNVLLILNDFIQIFDNYEKLNRELQIQTKTFAKFLPLEIPQYLGHNRIEDIQIGDQKNHQSAILTFDIRNFTTISEKLTTNQTLEFINSYFQIIEPVIKKYQGCVIRFLGDAILAIFIEGNFKKNALLCAEEIRNQFKQIGIRYKKANFGIGISSGNVLIATIGDEKRIDVGIFGKAVQLSDFLQFLNKLYGTQILVDEFTLLPELKKSYRYVDTILPPFLEKENDFIEIFENFYVPQLSVAKRRDFLQAYQLGIQHYKKKEFLKAKKKFQQALELYPQDKVSHLYIKRCSQYLVQSPLDWQPIVSFRRNLQIKDLI